MNRIPFRVFLVSSVLFCQETVLAQLGGKVSPVVQEAYLKASNLSRGRQFGESVAISGDTVVVGAPGANLAFVFVKRGGVWKQQAVLQASNRQDRDRFGGSVAISGDIIVVGARAESSSATEIDGNGADNGAPAAGAAYIFVRRGGTWSQEAYLKASNACPYDHFGASVAVSGDTVYVGAPDEDGSTKGIGGKQMSETDTPDSGAVYVFSRSGAAWVQKAYIKASNAEDYDRFGSSVAASGDTLVVGAPYESSASKGVDGDQADNAASLAGAAYVFVCGNGVWSQEAYLKASNAGKSDEFGRHVAISGDTVLVGAPSESSLARGVNGNQLDDRASGDVGAAYVFERRSGVWNQTTYLKASNAEEGDAFGVSGAVWGNILVIGALGESSQAAGIDGDQSDNGDTASGAAYAFLRKGDSWVQTAYMKASDPGASDLFGCAVGVSGSTIVVGARGEDSSSTGIDGDPFNDGMPNSGAAYVFHPLPPRAELAIKKSPNRFEPTRVGTRSRGKSLVVFNSGAKPLKELRMRLLGPGRRDFRIKGRVSRILEPGGTIRMNVIFQPTRTGTRRTTLSIVGSFRTKLVKLSGLGVPWSPRFPIGLP